MCGLMLLALRGLEVSNFHKKCYIMVARDGGNKTTHQGFDEACSGAASLDPSVEVLTDSLVNFLRCFCDSRTAFLLLLQSPCELKLYNQRELWSTFVILSNISQLRRIL